jgi:hypothetical protein
MSSHERSPSPARGACGMSLSERSPSPAPTIAYDSCKILKQVRRLQRVMKNMHWHTSRTYEEALDNSVRTFEWVYGHKPYDIVGWLLTLDLYNDKNVSFLDRVSDVCKISIPDAFVLIVENRPRINSIQQEIENRTAAEAAHIWLMDLRKVNISQTAVEKLQCHLKMQGAQARELLIEHIGSVIGIHKTQVGIEWDEAQSLWAWGWIEDNVPDPPPRTQSKRHHDENEDVSPAKQSKRHHDENEDAAPASPHRAVNTLGYSDSGDE